MFLKLEHRVQSLNITYKNRAKPSFVGKKTRALLFFQNFNSLKAQIKGSVGFFFHAKIGVFLFIFRP